jgi:hypothetical protein
MPATAAAVEIDRAEINRANSQHSTGPRTEAGKQRSAQNALRHGLTARSAVTPSEDQAAYQLHLRQFLDEYKPATASETQMVQQLADTSWRINRIPMLEADILARLESSNSGSDSPNPSPEPPAFDIVDAHRLLANLTLNSTRLSRQFQKTLEQLREVQLDRREREQRELKNAAAIHELNKYEGVSWEPSDHGFVFSKEQVERHAQRMIRQNQSRQVAFARFDMPYRPVPAEKNQSQSA